MHELSIALSILDIAAEESAQRGNARVSAIHVRLGTLSGVVKEALASAFDLARESSAFPQSELVITEVPITVFCPKCQEIQPVESIQRMCCRQCGTPSADVRGGNEMEITAMEIAELDGSGDAPCAPTTNYSQSACLGDAR